MELRVLKQKVLQPYPVSLSLVWSEVATVAMLAVKSAAFALAGELLNISQTHYQ